MTVFTIPKNITKKGELVIIPRREYQILLDLTKIREITMSKTEKRALARARKNYQAGKTISFNELSAKLGFRN